MWLRVGPQKALEPLMKVTELKSRITALAIMPLCEAGDLTFVWSADGCGFLGTGRRGSITVTYTFAPTVTFWDK